MSASVISEFWSEPTRVFIKSYTDAESVYGEWNRVQIIVLAGAAARKGPFSPFPQCHLPPYGEWQMAGH